MKRQANTRSIVQKTNVVEKYLFLSTNIVYEVKSTSAGLFMKKEKQDDTIFGGEIIQADWFPTKQEYLDSLIGFGLIKKI